MRGATGRVGQQSISTSRTTECTDPVAAGGGAGVTAPGPEGRRCLGATEKAIDGVNRKNAGARTHAAVAVFCTAKRSGEVRN